MKKQISLRPLVATKVTKYTTNYYMRYSYHVGLPKLNEYVTRYSELNGPSHRLRVIGFVQESSETCKPNNLTNKRRKAHFSPSNIIFYDLRRYEGLGADVMVEVR